MLMSGGKEKFHTEGAAKRSVIAVVSGSKRESGRTRLE